MGGSATAPPQSNRTVGIVIIVITIVILFAYIIWLYVTSRNNTGFFKPYSPTLAPGLTKAVPEAQFAPLTPRTKAKRDAMLNAALETARSKQRTFAA